MIHANDDKSRLYVAPQATGNRGAVRSRSYRERRQCRQHLSYEVHTGAGRRRSVGDKGGSWTTTMPSARHLSCWRECSHPLGPRHVNRFHRDDSAIKPRLSRHLRGDLRWVLVSPCRRVDNGGPATGREGMARYVMAAEKLEWRVGLATFGHRFSPMPRFSFSFPFSVCWPTRG